MKANTPLNDSRQGGKCNFVKQIDLKKGSFAALLMFYKISTSCLYKNRQNGEEGGGTTKFDFTTTTTTTTNYDESGLLRWGTPT